MIDPLVIVEGVRTPFCKSGSNLARLAADELGRIAVDALLTRTGFDRALVDEVIFGCVCQPVDAPNVARVIALRAGLPLQTGDDGWSQLIGPVRELLAARAPARSDVLLRAAREYADRGHAGLAADPEPAAQHGSHDHDQVDTEHSQQRDEHAAAIFSLPAKGRTTRPG